MTAAVIVLLSAALIFFLKAYRDGQFDSPATFKTYVNSFGIFAPLVLAIFQFIQVVIPILPGSFGCAAGAMLFGCMGGFICNYISISAGSIAAFFLARRYGVELVKMLFPGKKYEKWAERLGNSRSMTLMLFLCILLPLAPDDYLCYLAGITDMSSKKFFWIIVLGKPWIIWVYSMIFSGLL